MYKTSFKQKITLIIFGLFLCVILLEVGLRLGGFILLSLQELRNRASLMQRGEYRIMCLGESTTFLGGKYSYPRQLEDILNQKNMGIKFSVISESVCDTNTSNILAQLEGNLNKYKPDIVVTMMGINDDTRLGINDYNEIVSCEDVLNPQPIIFLRNLRIYKLAKSIWLHFLTKIQEATPYKPESKKLNIAMKDCSPKQEGPISEEKLLKKAIELTAVDRSTYIDSGWYYERHGHIDQAEEMFKKAAELNPGDYDTHVELASFYERESMWPQAEKVLKKVVEIGPQKADSYSFLGMHYLTQNKYHESEEMLTKTIELNPLANIHYINLGWCYERQGKYLKAEEAFRKAAELNSKDDLSFAGLAVLYEETGRNASAEEYFRKATTLRLKHCNPITRHNYQEVKRILDKRQIRLICVQYPMRDVELLTRMFEPGQRETTIFIDNAIIFRNALKKANFKEYFVDNFAGDFGHCTPKGNRLLAENIANTILREVFHK
jgi:Tfp pilus assembly protein PilF